jgi:chloramphenicol 3-O phosphotransferase
MREASYCGPVTTQLIILNGGSSSGKSGIIRCLQAVLPDPWLAFGCDSFTEALPAKMQESDAGIVLEADGTVSVGAEFRALEAAWIDGLVVTARAGARIILDEVFLGGAAGQQRWQKAVDGLERQLIARPVRGRPAGRWPARGWPATARW